ncbi:MAG: glycosyltransferase [Rubrivivax sp.]|jgi:glycosyltransferase involved in cell wall biosynthesis|nr:glycosyltransferase [Rubrivivax sp.]
MRASVVVPTRDRAAVLRACLESLTRQTAPPGSFEVVVVDNGSRDETATVARSFGGRLALTLLHEPEPGLHAGRHAGARAARSDVLMFCDDDIEAEPGWVEAVVRRFEDPRVALVGGNNRPLWGGVPPAWLDLWWSRAAGHGRALGYLSILDFGEGVFDIDPAWVWGCNFNVRRAALDAARGFHPDALPRELLHLRGDGEMHVGRVVRERGWRTLFDGAASVRHRVDASRMTPGYIEQRAFAQGVSDSYAAVRRRGGTGADLRRWLRPIASAWRDWRLTSGAGASPAVVEWRRVLAAARRAHAAGAAFHREALRRDPGLLAWVLRDDYRGGPSAPAEARS